MSQPREERTVELLLQHASWLRGLALSLVGDTATAEDLVQETWVAALTHRPETDRPLRPWLRRVIENFARRLFRTRKAYRLREAALEGPSDLPGPESVCEQLEAERLLTEELARLEEPFRMTLMLRYWRDLRPKEIARLQQIPDGTVRWRLLRGLELLRRRLDGRYGGVRRAWSLLLLPLARPNELAQTASTGAGTPFPWTLALKGIAMKMTWKVGAALAVVLVAATALSLGAILSGLTSSTSGVARPVEVSFRPPLYEPPPVPETPSVVEGESSRAEVEAASPMPSPEAPAAKAALLPRAWVEAVILDEERRTLQGAGLREVSWSGPREPAVADARGLVRLEVEIGEARGGVRLEAFREGYASQLKRVRAQPGQTVSLGTILLRPGGDIRGRVTDRTGRGVPAAVVHTGEADVGPETLEGMQFWRPELSVPLEVTDKVGSFALKGLPPGFHRIWARKKGRMPAYTPPMEVRAGQESTGVEIVLDEIPARNRIRGVVQDPGGEPVPFAMLEVSHSSVKGRMSADGSRRAEGDGTFDFLLFNDAVLSVTARDPEGRYGAASAEDVPAGAPPLVLRLSEAVTRELRVSSRDGRRVPWFGFDLLSAEEGLPLHESKARQRPEGMATFPVPAQAYLIRVTAPLHQVVTRGPYPAGGGRQAIRLRLDPLPGLRGAVHARGAPLGGARVLLQQIVPPGRRLAIRGFRSWLDPKVLDEARTDVEGRFVLTVRSPGTFVVRAEKEGLAPAEWGPFEVGPTLQAGPVEIRLGQGGAIEGRVAAPGGVDPAGVIIGIHRGDGYPQIQRAREDGTFRFAGLMPGAWAVERLEEEVWGISIRNSPVVPPFEEEVELPFIVCEGRTTRVDLRPGEENACRLEGSLVLDGGSYLGWKVWLHPREGRFFNNQARWPTTSLDPDGRFSLGVAESGVYKLVLKRGTGGKEELIVDEVRLGAGTTPWEMEVALGTAVIEGMDTAVPQDGIPPLVFLWEGGGDLVYVRLIIPDEDGVCRLQTVPAGRGKLATPTPETIEKPRTWKVVREVFIPPGEETRVTLP